MTREEIILFLVNEVKEGKDISKLQYKNKINYLRTKDFYNFDRKYNSSTIWEYKKIDKIKKIASQI